MGERNITLFELHFKGSPRFSPSLRPGQKSKGSDDSRDDSDAVKVHEEDDGGLPVKGAIIGVVALVALAVAARVLLGGDDDENDDVEMVDIDDAPRTVDDPGVGPTRDDPGV